MLIRGCAGLMLTAGLTVVSPGLVFSQNFPHKPIRIITTPVGGGNDIAARLLAQGLTEPLGQPVIIENRPSGVIPGEMVARAIPDGYTLLFGTGTVWHLTFMRDHVPYDMIKDFAPVSMTAMGPSVLVISPSLAVNSVTELINLAKAKPGQLNFATSASGSGSHLAGELFKSMAGINVIRIPYKGGGPALTDLIAGQVQFMITGTGGATPHIKSGKLRALAVTSARPTVLAPGLPTVKASGLPGYEFVSIDGIFAPAKTPAAVINHLNRELVRMLGRPDIKEKFLAMGVEAVGSSPAELAAEVKADMARMGKVIKDVGIRDE